VRQRHPGDWTRPGLAVPLPNNENNRWRARRRRESTPEMPRRTAQAQHGRRGRAHFAQRSEGAKPTFAQAGISDRCAFRKGEVDHGPAGIARSASAIGRVRQMIVLDNVLSALRRPRIRTIKTISRHRGRPCAATRQARAAASVVCSVSRREAQPLPSSIQARRCKRCPKKLRVTAARAPQGDREQSGRNADKATHDDIAQKMEIQRYQPDSRSDNAHPP
jgi:hypothetical protein